MNNDILWPTRPTPPRPPGSSPVDDQIETLLYQLIGERVRARRGSLTQTDLADRIGIGRTSVTNLELGQQRMPLHYLVRIAEALDCDVRELLPSREELLDGGTKVVLGVTDAMPPKAAALIGAHLANQEAKASAVVSDPGNGP